MKEIVEHILQEEMEARQKLDSARAQAKGIVAQAQAKGKELVEKTTNDTQASSQKDLTALAQRFLNEKEEILKSAKDKIIRERPKFEKVIPEAAVVLFRKIAME
ncbi:MAG: hypothetical protein PHQ96_04860 [Candidatus Omnitrophica bacterium]|nr:hypothetical protein [Candidatus Omnitrophota bacterium]